MGHVTQFVLVGQPYSGKSTIFNEVVGYRSLSTNAPGSTTCDTHGTVEVDGESIVVVDLPGIYSLQSADDAPHPVVEHIIDADDSSVIINVVDATVLSRSLELTLQLAELRRPMVMALNMVDDARKKGIEVDAGHLSGILGIPVVETVGSKGEGVSGLFREARRAGIERLVPAIVTSPASIERAIGAISCVLCRAGVPSACSDRLLAIRLIERDERTRSRLQPLLAADRWKAVEREVAALGRATEQPPEVAIASARHAQAFELFEAVAVVGVPRRRDAARGVDGILTHPVFGYVFLAAILAGVFAFVFAVGGIVEPVFVHAFDGVQGMLAGHLGEGTLEYAVASGVISGLGGGIGIVVPYLVPFFVALAILEDTGYLPRIAYLTDSLLHRIGLHGLSVVPLIMGYGCSVPGVLATRILPSRRDRLITASLITLVPCSARMTVIFGLIGFFISIQAAVLVYVINLVLVGVVGRIMSRAMPEESPGLLMEIPRYRMPDARAVVDKTWFRLREFVTIALPVLVAGSVALRVIGVVGLVQPINDALVPYTVGLLGFPAVVGTTLLFGVIRKEMALIMLFAVLGTSNVGAVMPLPQLLSYAVFVAFYVPCLATIAALVREFSLRTAVLITGFTLVGVSGLAVAVRLAAQVFM
jgi:ferrous iron transport protein B